ncbi:uncharacterized protein LOC123524787 isoform X3 [Mercenaria mercenaria]|uniref:uncharacterized protein LOC123524787 isoform X3 n=1 Tax=Mercenaria mercenaria TaxID=6596 RepID=UPI00234E3FCF|nr:uncharacterized protein LOC123524787 isoform X3 [Mercenaria mercenaria]
MGKTRKKPEKSAQSSPAVKTAKSLKRVTTEQEPSVTEQEVFVNHAVIKGYHVFKIKPPQVNQPLLTVDREYGNIHDHDACLVWLPNLNCYPQDLHEMQTDETRHLKLSDVAGLPIGHLPRGLDGCFRKILDQNNYIFVKITAEPTQNFPPWPAPSEKGGGAVIPCTYVIKTKHVDETVPGLKSAIQSMEERSVLNVTVND